MGKNYTAPECEIMKIAVEANICSYGGSTQKFDEFGNPIME